MVHKSGASTSSEHVEKIDDISRKSSAHGNHKSDDESQTATTALSANTKNPPKIDNGINFETKRKLRTSRRLNSLNPDLLPQPPLPLNEKTIDSAATNHHTKLGGPAATAVILAPVQPLCAAPKPIRNRRYTINECSNATGLRDAKDVTVPFQAKNKQDTIVLNNCLTTIAASAAAASTKSDRKRSCDDLNLLGDRLNCSVSLERLTGIIDTLVYQTTGSSRSDKDDASSGSNGGGNKIMCLYCDRSFSSQKLYGKHLERLHQSTSGRRLSARTSNSESAVTYPGCFYCNSGKVASLSGAELLQLVHHLVDEHRDKYFACKSCMIRYPSRDQLQQHLSEEHKIDNKRKTSSSLSKRNAKKVQSPLDGGDSASVDGIAADDSIAGESAMNEPEPSVRSLRLRRSGNDVNKKATVSSKPQLLTSEETFLSRLGIAQNRSPRSRKGAKNRRGCSSELFPLETSRSSRTSKNSKATQQNLVSETIEFSAPKVSNNKCEPVASVFDEDFYESVNVNVKTNLSCHLDGKLKTEGEENDGGGSQSVAPCTLANVAAVRSILVKSPVFSETEIHEATTTISAFTAFPTLLTAQQYGAEFQAGKMKKPITKNSWKWKWDCVKKYKYVNEGGKIVKKVKQPLAGLRDLSKLDMWTQLTMRMKHETVERQVHELVGGDESVLAVAEAAREEKRKLIAQLNQILDKRVLPQINVEQSDQTIIKIEFAEELMGSERTLLSNIGGSSSGDGDEHDITRDSNFPASLRLFKRERSANASKSPIVLSGEWARPRCYICVSCGSRFSTVRSLEEHKASKHPFVHSTHYEIVGKELIDGNLFRNFYIPSMALQRHYEHSQMPLSQRFRADKPFFGSNALCGGGGDDSMDSVTSYSLSISKSDSSTSESATSAEDVLNRNDDVITESSELSSTGTATSSSLTASNSIDDENANLNQLDSGDSSKTSVCTEALDDIRPKSHFAMRFWSNRQNAVAAGSSGPAATVKCSKCNRDCNGTMDLYRHMLDCSSDYAWLLAKKRNHIKYRYFGSRRRRTHRTSTSNTRKTIKPKKERDESKSKEPTTPRPRPSDGKFRLHTFSMPDHFNQFQFSYVSFAAESIQRMLENLPAKRAARQIFPNLTPKPVKSKKFVPNTMSRGGKILVKQKTVGGNTRSYKILSSSTTINTVGANLVLRKRRNVDQQLRLKRSTDAAGIVTIRRTRATAAANSKSASDANGRSSSDSKKKLACVARKSPRSDGKIELGNVIRRRTKAVVKKIANTFRKGTQKHIIRTATASTSTDGGNGKTTTSTSHEPQKKRKILRSISFRRSARNMRKGDALKLPKATVAVAEEKKVVPNDDDAKTTKCEKQMDEKEPNKNSTKETSAIDAAKIVEEDSSQAAVETASESPPKLKRKRSIKTIINDIRAKCQSKSNAKVTENEVTSAPLQTVVENEVIPSTNVEPSVTTSPSLPPNVSVTIPLSLTIETNDEPLDLCITSPANRNLASQNSAGTRPASVTPTTSSLSVPATTPSSANQMAESISPRRRTRKINDCIAMLTGKLQEKLGVPFIDQSSSLLAVLGTDSPSKDESQALSTSTEQLAAPQEMPAADAQTVNAPEKVGTAEREEASKPELSSAPGCVENIQSEPMISAAVDANELLPETQESAESSLPAIESEKLPELPEPMISENDKKESENIKEIEIVEIVPVEAIASSDEAVKTDISKEEEASVEKTIVKPHAEVAAQEATSDLITAIDVLREDTSCKKTVSLEPPVAETSDTYATEPAKEEVPSEKKIVVAKKTPNRKQKSAKPKAKAAKPKEKPNKKLGTVPAVAETEKPNLIQLNNVPEAPVVASEVCDQTSVVANEPTAASAESEIISDDAERAGQTVEPKPEETIVEPVKVEKPSVEASVDIVLTKNDAPVRTTASKSRKTASSAKCRASTTTKSAEKPVSDNRSPSKAAEKIVPLPDATSSNEKVETPSFKVTPKDNKKSQSNAKRKTAVTPKAKPEKSSAKTKASPITGDKSTEQTPPKSKRATPSSRKSLAPTADSIFESSDEELLPWDPETGFIGDKSDLKTELAPEPMENKDEGSDKQNLETQQELTGNTALVSPVETTTPSTTTTPTPSIASAVPSTDSKPKKKRKNELAQIIADQLLESFKEVDKSRISELKKIHDLSLSSSDDLLTTSLSTTPTPKRKSKKIFENIETKSRTQSPKVDSKRVPEVKLSKETDETKLAESTVPVESPPLESSKEVEPPKVKKSRSKRVEVDDKSQSVACESPPPLPNVSEPIAEDVAAAEASAAVQTKIMENVENVPKKSSGNIFLDGFSETLFGDADKNHLKATIDSSVAKVSKTMAIASETTVSAISTPSTTTVTLTTTTTTTNASLKAPAVFGESLFSQQNLKTTRLSDLIGVGTNIKIVDAATKVSPMKNKSVENLISFDKLSEIKTNARAPFMSPRWESNTGSDDKVEMKNKVNFWGRTIGDEKNVSGNQKSRIFAVIKNKTEKMFPKMSKKKLKKSLKASISSSSSSSTSSSTSSNVVPKRPLLRPSILSCNSKQSTNVDDDKIENIPKMVTSLPEPPPTSPKKTTSDIFDLLIAPAAIQSSVAPPVARKIGSIRRKTAKSTEQTKLADSKLPVIDPQAVAAQTEPPDEFRPKSQFALSSWTNPECMNIAKIVIALEKSNRKNSSDESLLNKAFIAADHRTSNVPFKEQQQKPLSVSTNSAVNVEKTATPPLQIPAPTAATPSITTELLNDSSQDTMISEIVSKIREKVNRTDSDDDLCLAEVAKGLNNRSPSPEFDLTLSPNVHANDISNSKPIPTAQPSVNDESDVAKATVICPTEENDAETADDENTNTEVLDMDLEDDASEYTALSHDTSTTSVGGSKKRKRKKRSILSRTSRRSKKRDDSFVLPAETYFCDMCRKSFKNQSGLTSHKSTISHIAKVSEQEFLEASLQSHQQSVITPKHSQSQSEPSVSASTNEDVDTTAETKSADVAIEATEPNADASTQPTDSTSSQQPPSKKKKKSAENATKKPKAEAVATAKSGALKIFNIAPSAIKNPQSNRFSDSSINTTRLEIPSESTAPTPTSTSAALSINARMTLSQEERLFYECCSMLKGSDRSATTTTTTTTTTSTTSHESSKNELASNPITPKTNQHHTNIAHSAQSPRSHPSPRPGIPTLDLNQFSDISSDSNPAYSCPQIPSSSKTQKVFSLEASDLAKVDVDKDGGTTRVSTIANYQYAKGQSQQKSVVDKAKGDAGHRTSSIIVRNYPDTFSDMGDSFPSSQDASESENYAQTILERSVHIHDGPAINNSMRSGHSSKLNDSGFSLSSVPTTLNPDLTDVFQTCSNR